MILKNSYICVFWPQKLNEPNRTRYQRILTLARHFPVYLIARGGQDISDEVQKNVYRLKRSPSVKNLYLSHCMYLMYAFFVSTFLILVRKLDVVYSFVDQSCICSYCMKHVFHKKWIADVIDYPDSELQDLKDDSWSLKKFVYWIIVKLLKKTLPSADLVFALGPNKEVGLPSELINGYGLSEEKVHPVLEGTDLSRTKPVGLKNDHSIFKVCYVGSLKRIRGIDHLIEATEIAREQLPNIKTYLLGDIRYSEDKQALLDMVKRYNIEEHIFLSEARVPHQDVLDHIETSDVCLLLLDPSKTNYHYSYPIKLFEYLAMGKAVVSTNFPGIEEVVHSEHNGLLVPFGNSESLAKAIVRIAQDIKLKKTLEQNARPSIIDFDWAILNQKILDVIHSRFIRKDFE